MNKSVGIKMKVISSVALFTILSSSISYAGLSSKEPYFSKYEIIHSLQSKANKLLKTLIEFETRAKEIETKAFNSLLDVHDQELRSAIATDLRGYVKIIHKNLDVMREVIVTQIRVLRDLKTEVAEYPEDPIQIDMIPGLKENF